MVITCGFSCCLPSWRVCHKCCNWTKSGFHPCYGFVHEWANCIACWRTFRKTCSHKSPQQLCISSSNSKTEIEPQLLDTDTQQTWWPKIVEKSVLKGGNCFFFQAAGNKQASLPIWVVWNFAYSHYSLRVFFKPPAPRWVAIEVERKAIKGLETHKVAC